MPTHPAMKTDETFLLEATIRYMAIIHFQRGSSILCMSVIVVRVNGLLLWTHSYRPARALLPTIRQDLQLLQCGPYRHWPI
jgi:hypothetical protein